MEDLAKWLFFICSCYAFYWAGKSDGKTTRIEFNFRNPRNEYRIDQDENGNMYIEHMGVKSYIKNEEQS